MHNGLLDHTRLLAAFGIVLFHTGAPGGGIGYAALPFFLIVLLMLGGAAAARQPFGAYAARRARRLLLPWLLWSGVYGGLKLAEALVEGQPLDSAFFPWMLLTGPAIHLWFLPFAFAASLLLPGLMRIAQPAPVPVSLSAALSDRRGLLLVLCGGAALAALALAQGGILPAPLAQWREALPAICLGFGFAVAARRAHALIAFGGICLAAGLGALALGWTDGLPQLAVALLGLGVCLAWPRPATPLSSLLGQSALGVYLVHPLVIAVLLRATPLPEASLALALVATGISLGLTLALSALLRVRRTGRTGHPAGLAAN